MSKDAILLENLTCIENMEVETYNNYFMKMKNEMEHPEWIGGFSNEDLAYILSHGSKTWTYFLNDELVCSVMYIEPRKDGLASIGITYDAEDCAEIGIMYVMKDFRGRGLQNQMFQKVEMFCLEKNLKYMITTADPSNIYSVHNIEKMGYEKVGFQTFERGPRNIYVKTLSKNSIE